MVTTYYNINTSKTAGLTIGHLSDIHGKMKHEMIDALKKEKPDLIALTGDFGEGDYASSDKSLEFLRELSNIAPTFYSLGNHELGLTETARRRICSGGVHLLDDSFIRYNGITVGGLTSGFFHSDIGNGRANPHPFKTPKPSIEFLDSFCKQDGFLILLCHHPEYYFDYIQGRKIDLVLSGHAHGGQIRLFGRGLMAPGQGLFPKYTSGLHDGRLVISRGLANTGGLIPRLFNETELVMAKIDPNPLTKKAL